MNMKSLLGLFLRPTSAAFVLGAMMAAPLAVLAAPVNVTGGTPAAPTDITAQLLANQDLNFTGGNYVVRLPQAGAGIVAAKDVDGRISSETGFSSSTNPTLRYEGILSGNGVLTVQSAFNANRESKTAPFTGGALMFTNYAGQSWGVEGMSSGGHNASALIIDPNATVYFWFPGEADKQVDGAPRANAFPYSTTVSRNITNNGFLFSTTANVWSSITGTGITSMAFYGGDSGRLGSTADLRYSGQAFNTANGAHWGGGALIEDQPNGQPTTFVTRGLTVFEPLGTMTLLDRNYKISDPVKRISQNMYNWSINIQLWWSGIHHFTGIFLPTTASKSFLQLATASDAVKGVYSYNGGGMAFGRVINLNNKSTLLMGDGREIVTNPDGITTNVWLQGNPFNTLLSTSNFVNTYPGLDKQALAYVYSGTYRINHNMNASVDARAGVIKDLRNNYWTNFYLLDPKAYNPRATAPNHAIVTVPVFFGGLTRIDTNAVLQLGDGTIGNNAPKTLSFEDGSTVTFPYSDSSGNGMLITKGNDHFLPKTATMKTGVAYEIRNNGSLIVNNTPGAWDATASGATTGASPEVAAWVSANQLDGITGTGSVEQKGSLPLTLGSPDGNDNTYTGGTRIRPNATLIAASSTALGQRDTAATAAPNSGRVINNGGLKAAPGTRTIKVPGDYVQSIVP